MQNCALLRRHAGALPAKGHEGHSAASQNFIAACLRTSINKGCAVSTRLSSNKPFNRLQPDNDLVRFLFSYGKSTGSFSLST